MGQQGFWDEEQRIKKLQDKKPVLALLSTQIPWNTFQPPIEHGYSQERKSNTGRKRIDPLILFKMLVLQQLFNLSDEELEFQVNDRRSFKDFIGLGVMNSIPNATTVAFFRERLRHAEVPWTPSLLAAYSPAQLRSSFKLITPSLRFSPCTQVGKAFTPAWRQRSRPSSFLSHST